MPKRACLAAGPGLEHHVVFPSGIIIDVEVDAVEGPEYAPVFHYGRSAFAEFRTSVSYFLKQILKAHGLDVRVKVGFVAVDAQVLFYYRKRHLILCLSGFL